MYYISFHGLVDCCICVLLGRPAVTSWPLELDTVCVDHVSHLYLFSVCSRAINPTCPDAGEASLNWFWLHQGSDPNGLFWKCKTKSSKLTWLEPFCDALDEWEASVGSVSVSWSDGLIFSVVASLCKPEIQTCQNQRPEALWRGGNRRSDTFVCVESSWIRPPGSLIVSVAAIEEEAAACC